MRHTIPDFICLTLALALTACDDHRSAEAPVVHFRDVDFNGPFGPCDGECKGGACFFDDNGSFCAPPCSPGFVCPPTPPDVCGDIPVGSCNPAGSCLFLCEQSSDCPAGMTCVAGGMGFCVWPWP